MGLEKEIDRIYRESLEADYEAISRTAQPTGHYVLRSAMGNVDFEAVQAVPVNHVCLGTRPRLYAITSCTLRLITPDDLEDIAERRESVIRRHLAEENPGLRPEAITADKIREEDTFTGELQACARHWNGKPKAGSKSRGKKPAPAEVGHHHGGQDREQAYQPAYDALRSESPSFSLEPKATELPKSEHLPGHDKAAACFDIYPVVTFENVDYIRETHRGQLDALVAGGLLRIPEDGFVDRWPRVLEIQGEEDSVKYIRADLVKSGVDIESEAGTGFNRITAHDKPKTPAGGSKATKGPQS